MYGMILQGARSLGVEGMERLVADLKAAILAEALLLTRVASL